MFRNATAINNPTVAQPFPPAATAPRVQARSFSARLLDCLRRNPNVLPVTGNPMATIAVQVSNYGLVSAQAAAAQVPRLMDVHAEAAMSAQPAQRAAAELVQLRERTGTAVEAEQAKRGAAVDAATLSRDTAQTKRNQAAAARDLHSTARDNARQEGMNLQAALSAARTEMLNAQTSATARATALLAAQNAAPVVPWDLQQAEEQNRQALVDQGAAEHSALLAQAAFDQNITDTAHHEGQLLQTQDHLNVADSELTAAQQALTEAEAAVTRLTNLHAAATRAFDTHLPAVQAHETASQQAALAAGIARQAHTTLAQLTQIAARDAQSATDAENARNEKNDQILTLTTAHENAGNQLAPNGPLNMELAAAETALDQALDALNLLAPATRPGSPQQAAHAQAQQRVNNALAGINAAQQESAALLVQLDQATPQLPPLQQAAIHTDTVAQASEAARTTQDTVAQHADAAALQARTDRDATQGPADAARGSIETALTALRVELAPQPRAAALHPGMGRADGLRGALQGFGNRLAPAKFEGTLLGIGGSYAGSGPATFNGGHAPGRTVTNQAMSTRGQAAIDHKAQVAGTEAASLLAGKPETSQFSRRPQAAARTPEALGSAVDFTAEVRRLFEAPNGSSDPTTVAMSKEFAYQLLYHPSSRPEGHPLRHEEALLIASTLSTLTDDPVVAANLYNQLWNDPNALTSVATHARAESSPLASIATEPRDRAISADPMVLGLAQAARRTLARSATGMDALLNLQGLSLPPVGDANRREAEHAIENYKLSLRAEEALLGLLGMARNSSSDAVVAAVNARPGDLLDANRLGTGGRPGSANAEHPATLASQALVYAKANMNRGTGTAELHPDFKPAYVALRNGFTQSGHRSDFQAMTRRLHKFITYIDRASRENEPRSFQSLVGQAGRVARRAVGMDKSPLTTMLKAGPMGSDLGSVPAEYKKQLSKAVTDSADLLEADLNGNIATLTDADRTRGLVRVASLKLWGEKLAAGSDPYAPVSLSFDDVERRAQNLAAALPNPALDAPVVRSEFDDHLANPMKPQLLDTWFGNGKLADPTARANDKMKPSFKMLLGQGPFVSGLGALHGEYDGGNAAQRREVLRKVMISVVAGGDTADYSDGRKNGISGVFGFSPAGVVFNDHTIGIAPVVEASYERTRSAVLRAGVASNSGVLYLGSETRHGGSAGLGVRAGIQVAPGQFTASAMARLGVSHASSKGLMIRTNKRGVEYEALSAAQRTNMQSANWKQMSELVVNSIFDLAGAGVGKPENAHDMWVGMVNKVGDYRDISFGYNGASNTSANWSLQADGIAGVNFGGGNVKASASLALGVGLRHTFLNSSKAKDSAGSLQTMQAASGTRFSAIGSGSAGFTHPTIKTPDGGSVLLSSRSKIGVESELVINASNGFVRLTTEDGRVNPLGSYKHREYAVEADFTKLVNAQRATWVPQLGERGLDGKLHNGAETLNTFLTEMANLPPGKNRTFIERKSLLPEAADAINAYMTRLDVLQGNEHAQEEITALQQRIANEVNKEANWQPFRLMVNEQIQKATQFTTTLDATGAPKSGPNPWTEHPNPADLTGSASGKLTLGAHAERANAGRDLLTLDAQPTWA